MGVRFHLGTTVAAVHADDAGAEVSTTGGPEAGVFRGGMACSTLPLPVLATLLADAPAPVRVAAASLRFRALALVYLVLPQPRYTPFDAHYFPALDAPFSRVSEPKNYRDGAGSDPPDRTVLCAEVPCSVGDEVWTASDDDLGALVAEALARQGLPPARAVGVEVRRLPTAYPVYRSGFEEPLTTLAEWVERHPTVLTFGRQGLFAHDNTHHALAMGMAAAASLRTGHLDRDGWNRSLESFRDNVVED